MFGVPTTASIMHPALSYHSSIDTMDKVDPGVLKRNGIITGAYLYFIALPEEDDIRWLLAEIREHAEKAIRQKEGKDSPGACLLGNAFFNGCLSLKKLMGSADPELLEEIDKTADALPKPALPGMPALQEGNARFGERVPERITPGCLSFFTMSAKERESARWKPFYNYELNCPLFWTDGKRNLWDIACLTAYELGKDPEDLFRELQEYYRFLEKHGYIRFNNINIMQKDNR
jgi:hypothetical protein